MARLAVYDAPASQKTSQSMGELVSSHKKRTSGSSKSRESHTHEEKSHKLNERMVYMAAIVSAGALAYSFMHKIDSPNWHDKIRKTKELTARTLEVERQKMDRLIKRGEEKLLDGHHHHYHHHHGSERDESTHRSNHWDSDDELPPSHPANTRNFSKDGSERHRKRQSSAGSDVDRYDADRHADRYAADPYDAGRYDSTGNDFTRKGTAYYDDSHYPRSHDDAVYLDTGHYDATQIDDDNRYGTGHYDAGHHHTDLTRYRDQDYDDRRTAHAPFAQDFAVKSDGLDHGTNDRYRRNAPFRDSKSRRKTGYHDSDSDSDDAYYTRNPRPSRNS